MSSIRKRCVGSAVMVSALALSAGCQGIVPPPTRAPVNDTPLVVDEAMQLRDWERSTNYYANGATVAGGTGYLWQTHEAVAPGHRRFLEAPVAVLNIASMPVGVFVNSPFGSEVYRGETVPPTYTAQPPLPGQPSTPVNGSAPEALDAPIPPPSETTPAPTDTSSPETVSPAPPAPPEPVTPSTPPPVDPITPAPTPDPLAPAPGTETPPPLDPVEPVEPVPPPAPPAPPAESVPQ